MRNENGSETPPDAPVYDAAVVCSKLTRDYGAGHGIFDLDLEVKRGETFGFIGPNGAGRSTTIRLLMDLIRPDRGTATLLGMDSRADSLPIKAKVGYLPGELMHWPRVSAGYVIGMLAGLHGGVDEDRIHTLADRLHLDLGRRFEDLSHGNKQKVGLIQTFMHEPELLILDEPTLGLDPLVQREFRHLLREAVAGGATVFLSSHVLSEVELVCDRIALIRDGRLLKVGSLNELRALRIHQVDAVFNGTLDLTKLEGVPVRHTPSRSRRAAPGIGRRSPTPTRRLPASGPTRREPAGGERAHPHGADRIRPEVPGVGPVAA